MPSKTKYIRLVDVLLALLMLGILAGLYLTTRGNDVSQSIDAACRKVQSDIRYAQQLSMTSKVNHGVLFEEDGSYRVYAGEPGNVVMDPATRKKLIETLAEFKGVRVQNDFQVEFNEKGESIIGGGERVRIVADGDGQRDIYVAEKSGAVIIKIIK